MTHILEDLTQKVESQPPKKKVSVGFYRLFYLGFLPPQFFTSDLVNFVQTSGQLGVKKQVWLVVSFFFNFHPYLGKISIFTNIFQMG